MWGFESWNGVSAKNNTGVKPFFVSSFEVMDKGVETLVVNIPNKFPNAEVNYLIIPGDNPIVPYPAQGITVSIASSSVTFTRTVQAQKRVVIVLCYQTAK